VAGLFTLDSESLGVLDTNVLGGFGTGFVVGSVTSAGSVSGFVGFAGSVSGSQSSAGSVTGIENNTGSVSGSVVSSGSVTGIVAFSGVVAASSTANGTASGNPSLFGSSVSVSVSAGTVVGSKPTPPPAPEPEPEGGGFAPRWLIPPQLQKLRLRGRIIPRRSRSTGSVSGSRTESGAVSAVHVSDGFVRGLAHIIVPVLIPPRDSVRERQAADDEFLMLVDS